MKNVFTAMAFLGAVVGYNGQIIGCTSAPNGAYPDSIVTPVCNNSNEIVGEWGFTGEYTLVKLLKNVSYEFSASRDSGTAFITISENNATPIIIASGTNKVVYTPGEDQVVRFFTHLNSSCANNDFEFVDRKVKCLIEVRNSYCEPVLNCSDGAVITKVKFADLEHSSNCSSNGFNDFTNKKATVEKGKTYTFESEIGFGWYNQSVSVWIDYNKNFLFEPEEFVYIGTIDQGSLSKDISIPANIASGDYRMRVRLATVTQSGATPTKACDMNDAYGETEDYTLTVVDYLAANETIGSDITLAPNPVKDVLRISSSMKVSKIEILNTSGQIVKTVTSRQEIDLKSLTAGLYIVNVHLENSKILSRKVIKE